MIALGAVAIVAATASGYTLAPPVTGKFGGQANPPAQGPLSWTGTVTYATPGAPDSAYLTSGSVSWTVSGTDSSGCIWDGTGSFAFNSSFALSGGRDGGITFNGNTYSASVGTANPDPMSSWALPVTVTCPGESPQNEYEEWGGWLETGPGRPASGSQLTGTYSYPDGLGTWNWNLTASTGLVARPGGPYSVLRGDTVTLDGSASTPASQIQAYKWTFAPGPGCPKGLKLAPGTGEQGQRVKLVVLCSLNGTLTVSGGGQQSQPAPFTINVRARPWNTPVMQADPAFVYANLGGPPTITKTAGGKHLLSETMGENVSDCPGASPGGRALADELICPLKLEDGFTVVGPIDDPHGPFNGFYYVGDATYYLLRLALINEWLAPGAPALPGYTDPTRNWYSYNARHGHAAQYMRALLAHESWGRTGYKRSGHTQALAAGIKTKQAGEPLDPRALAEEQFSRDRDGLIDLVEDKVRDDQEPLFKTSADPLATIWSGLMWTWSTDFGKWLEFTDVVGPSDSR